MLLGGYLWDQSGNSIDGVGIALPDPARFPRYTGSLLVQDTDGDRTLDPTVDRVIGGLVIDAPPGATGQAARSPVGADGRLVLSGNMVRSPRFPPEAGGGKLEHGLVPITFRTGNTAAVYRPRIIPLDGSSYAFTITAHE